MATSKPDIMIILLSKLIEEGDSFYKVREPLHCVCRIIPQIWLWVSDELQISVRGDDKWSSLCLYNRRGR